MAAATSAQEAHQMPFIKNLASSDRKLRTASLAALQAFLASRRALSPLDAQKLWTGLYYALWMTDRPRPQQALASDLADLLFDLPAGAGAGAGSAPPAREWLAGFWAVLGAQWPSIEALRMDKFMLLARRVFAAQVRFAREHGFACAAGAASPRTITTTTTTTATATVNNDENPKESSSQRERGADLVLRVMREWCFDPEDEHRVALGLRLHILDIWVDELEREGALAAAAEQGETGTENQRAAGAFVRAVGAMVEELGRKTPNRAIRERVRQSYGEDERLPWVGGAQGARRDDDGSDGREDDGDEDDEWGGLDD